jgi:hypothetical protein
MRDHPFNRLVNEGYKHAIGVRGSAGMVNCCEAVILIKDMGRRVDFFCFAADPQYPCQLALGAIASQRFTMPADPQGGGLGHALRLNFSFIEK